MGLSRDLTARQLARRRRGRDARVAGPLPALRPRAVGLGLGLDDLEGRQEEIPRDKDVILYCS